MAEWVDCTTGPNWFGGFAADMGEYLLDSWPLMPTAVTDGLASTNGDEIDFIVGLPNLAHPNDPNVALDDSYDSPIWGSYRYMVSFPPPDSGYGWYTGSVGSAARPDGSTPPPAGCHLWVVAYVNHGSGDMAPGFPPEHYVARTYVTSGKAPFVTMPGGWSDWQPGAIVEHAAQLKDPDGSGFGSLSGDGYHIDSAGGTYHIDGAPSSTYPPPGFPLALTNAPAAESAYRSAILADTPATGSDGATGGQMWSIKVRRDMFFGAGFYFPSAEIFISAGQHSQGWHAETALDFIDLTARGLTYGVDFDDPPFYNYGPTSYNRVSYEGDAAVPHWRDVANLLIFDSVAFRDSYDHNHDQAYESTIDLFLGARPVKDMAGNSYDGVSTFWGSPHWLDLSGFDLLATLGIRYTANGSTAVATGLSLDTAPVALSALLAPGTTDFVLAWQPSWTLAGDPPLYEPPVPDIPPPAHGLPSGEFTAPHLTLDPAALVPDTFAGFGGPVPYTGLPYDAHNPRWRYYKPPVIFPICPPGSKPRITVIEGHWSDWQPGYNFTSLVAAFSTIGGAHGVLAESPGYASDAHALGQTALNRLRTGAADDVGLGSSSPMSAEMLISSLKRPDLFTSAPTTSVSIDYRYWYLKQTAYATRPITASPPLPPGAVSGTPPAGTPNVAMSVEFDGTTDAAFVQWADQNWFFQYVTHIRDADGTGPTLPNTRFRVGLVDPSLVTDYTTFLPYGSGITIAEQIFTAVSESPSTVSVPMVVPPGFTDLSMAMAFQLGFLGPDDYPLPDYPYVGGFGNEYDVQLNVYFPPGLRPIYLTPRWRYWVPSQLQVDCIGHQYLRMTQRDDGLGIHGHPRLPITSMPTSQQLARAPRVRGPNTYS